jgi:protease I
MESNMEHQLNGMRIAILAMDGFEQIELTSPRDALQESGATTRIVSARRGAIQGVHHGQPGDRFEVDLSFDDAEVDDFDAVLLPGGAQNAGSLRHVGAAQAFVTHMQESGKPIAVICHGGWLLVSAGLVQGRTMTSWPALEREIRDAGGNWVDQKVAVDDNMISSRKPEDLPAFNERLLGMLTERFRASVRGTGDEKASSIGLDG